MIASLMMYARPETQAAHDRYWRLIRQALADRHIAAPQALSNDLPPFEVWRHPGLVLSQTCGLPYRTRLHAHVRLVGTPDYGLEGCAPGYYRSALIVRDDAPGTGLADFRMARFAYNEVGSQSGFAAPYAATAPLGFWFGRRVASGGHWHSARMVAEGEADIAGIDAQTWRLMIRYAGFARRLRVLAWTEPTPGLPYITGQEHDAQDVADATSEAILALNAADRETLDLKALVPIPKAAYLAVPTPPETAI